MSEDWLIGAASGAAVFALLALAHRPLLRLLGFELVASSQRPRDTEERPSAPRPAREQARPERDRTAGLLEIAEFEVSDVMVHRTAMKSVNADDAPGDIVRQVLGSEHDCLPLWRGTIDNIIGVIHGRDLMSALHAVENDASRIDIVKVAAKPWFVPDTTTLRDQLAEFMRRRSHFAIVVDEYGEVEGLVTLDDIIEEIVGELADEHDIDLPGVKKEADGSVTVDGSVPIRDLNRALNWELPDDEATTIAGLVIHETQTIPDEKQAFTFHGKRFVVLKRERNRITRLRIRTAVAAS